ncbi:MAG: hypothetical protein U0359_07510 [Byssovorax sp.]
MTTGIAWQFLAFSGASMEVRVDADLYQLADLLPPARRSATSST